MSIFWCKNVFCTRYENLLFTEKNIYNYSGFYQALSAINVYEIFLASVFKSYSIKWRPSKTKIAMWKSIPITHCVIYHHQKAKRIFCNAKFIEGPEPPDGSNDRTLFRVLSDGFSSGFSVIKSSLGSLGEKFFCLHYLFKDTFTPKK